MPLGTSSTAQPFAHLQAQHATLYRQVLDVFVRAKQRFTVHLRPEDVVAELGAGSSLETIRAALDQLAEWGNLRADPDTGRVTTVEDFHRARYLYQLSPEGHAVEQAVAAYETALGRRGALQSVALSDIAEQLRALLVVAESTAAGELPDAAKTHLLMMSLVDRFTGLADNAQAFMASLRRAIDFADADVAAFLAYKEQLIAYLERFIADLANRGAEIALLARQIEAAGVAPLLLVAARREAADAAPTEVPVPEGTGTGTELDATGTGAEAAPAAGSRVRAAAGVTDDVGADADGPHRHDAAVGEALDGWRQRWAGLRDWFVSADGSRPSQARLLRTAAIGAIRQLLGTVAAINERRSGRSDRTADFRRLALWFAQAPDDEAAHRLWHTAFGLSPARHLTVTAETLAVTEQQPVAAATLWAQAPRLEISPRLRRTGSYERRGSPNRVIDRSEQRRLLAERMRHEAEQTARARTALATPGPVALSELARLDSAEFRLFLQLLGDALAASRPNHSEVETTTSDGTMAIRLRRIAGGAPVRIVTEDGVLAGPEHLIEIVDLVGAAR
ncbi:TIGR02677 family protein [Micromonospora sp. DR5-3]|uniref:TIGR02677 family protein n=1 Tax=unclassified Micromonospora TaxID=2617518 RepID=UPI0011D7C51E|nr:MULTISPECIES: TIGR02677 family protein [unclassified Micromonospora]MCW3817985.1 TIGR02677 family protein [Micromonospora sp. DR5-3]TYC19061.1 TIGR02677 family protein [Micromonospora sp. MP36]